jgi:hypothetical protein
MLPMAGTICCWACYRSGDCSVVVAHAAMKVCCRGSGLFMLRRQPLLVAVIFIGTVGSGGPALDYDWWV